MDKSGSASHDSKEATDAVLACIEGKGDWWGKQEKNGVTYRFDMPDFPVDFKDVLVHYSKFDDDDNNLKKHCNEIREQAWSEFAYPCIGLWSFIEFNIISLPSYSCIVERLRSGNNTYLDLGCCFGADMRKLLREGAPACALHGVDIERRFFELGCALFRDPGFSGHFSVLDIFDNAATAPHADRYDVVNASQLFHLFTRDEQVTTLQTAIGFLKPVAGSMLVGRQLGKEEPAEWDSKASPSGRMFANSLETWAETVKEALAKMPMEFRAPIIERRPLAPSWDTELGRRMGCYSMVFEITRA